VYPGGGEVVPEGQGGGVARVQDPPAAGEVAFVQWDRLGGDGQVWDGA
jgi:hypothetical protein